MLTIKAEVRKDKLRKDNTFNVKIRLCYERKVIRLSTEKYYSETSQSIFRFSQDYSTPENFNRAINLGLKDVGSDVGIPSRFPKSFSRRQNSLQEFLFTIMQTHLIADEYKNFGQLK